MQLAEKYYAIPKLYQELTDNFKDKNIVNDGKTIQERLRSGQLDYFFVYESSAKQAGYRYITFPEQIDFSDINQASYYEQAVLKVTGKTEGTYVEVKGQPIVYGVTLVKNAPQRKEALQFLKFLLTDGQEFMAKAGLIPINPPEIRENELSAIPAEIKDQIVARQ